MALRHADVSVQQMADELGMARSSLSRWLNDRVTPPRAALVTMWALRTGVPLHWIRFGHARTPAQGDLDGGRALCVAPQARAGARRPSATGATAASRRPGAGLSVIRPE
ncbi:helix-turn-helix domain-containing protein [Cellulomonas sp. Y8]|uniref:helix-turn-helix domain-containing protein n=1 Tax=Cellulomonas sp. Y8 TaxID=2591145 RepID=UPI003526DE76